MKTIVSSLSDLATFADMFVASLVREEKAITVALHGELGAGKTTLTQELARLLGVTEAVSSPTFVIMKQYEIPSDARFKKLVHADLYRVDDESELTVLKFDEMLRNPDHLVVIEWAERAHSLLPKDTLDVHIAVLENGDREITYVRQFA